MRVYHEILPGCEVVTDGCAYLDLVITVRALTSISQQ